MVNQKYEWERNASIVGREEKVLKFGPMMDYYIFSNELRVITQRLKRYFDQVFESSLNTSLATGKLVTNADESEVYQVMSQKIETISKKLNESILQIIYEANCLTRHSLGNKLSSAKIDQFQKSLPIAFGENNKKQIELAILQLNKEMRASMDEAVENLSTLDNEVIRLKSLNEQVWLMLSNIRVQMAQGQEDSNLKGISHELEVLSEEVEGALNDLDKKITDIKSILKSAL